jgi:DNA-binding MarR family transcriptional regulator
VLPSEITSAEYQALAEFRYQIRSFLAFSKNAAHATGVEPQQHQLMLALKAAAPKPATVQFLASRLQLRHHSTVELIDRMEALALVRRSRSKEDRRSAEIRLTAKGAKILRVLSLHHRNELRSAIPALIKSLTLIQNGQKSHVEP